MEDQQTHLDISTRLTPPQRPHHIQKATTQDQNQKPQIEGFFCVCFAFGHYSFVMGFSLVGYDEGAMGVSTQLRCQGAPPDPWLHIHCITLLYYELLSNYYYYFNINKEVVSFSKKKTKNKKQNKTKATNIKPSKTIK